MAAKSAYSGSWSCSRLRAPWKRKSSSKHSVWNPTVGETGSGASGHLATRHSTRTHAPTVQHHLTMGSVFYCVAKGTTEEMLRLQAECGVESDVTDFYSGPLEEGDLVLQGQGPAEAGVRPELPRGRQQA